MITLLGRHDLDPPQTRSADWLRQFTFETTKRVRNAALVALLTVVLLPGATSSSPAKQPKAQKACFESNIRREIAI
jgi:hypothetical protein